MQATSEDLEVDVIVGVSHGRLHGGSYAQGLNREWMLQTSLKLLHAVALIGNGAQSEFEAIVFRRMLRIEEQCLFDTDILPDPGPGPLVTIAAIERGDRKRLGPSRFVSGAGQPAGTCWMRSHRHNIERDHDG